MRLPRFRFISEHPQGWDAEVSLSGDANISEVMDAFEAFLLAAGYSEQTVKGAMGPTVEDAHL